MTHRRLVLVAAAIALALLVLGREVLSRGSEETAASRNRHVELVELSLNLPGSYPGQWRSGSSYARCFTDSAEVTMPPFVVRRGEVPAPPENLAARLEDYFEARGFHQVSQKATTTAMKRGVGEETINVTFSVEDNRVLFGVSRDASWCDETSHW